MSLLLLSTLVLISNDYSPSFLLLIVEDDDNSAVNKEFVAGFDDDGTFICCHSPVALLTILFLFYVDYLDGLSFYLYFYFSLLLHELFLIFLLITLLTSYNLCFIVINVADDFCTFYSLIFKRLLLLLKILLPYWFWFWLDYSSLLISIGYRGYLSVVYFYYTGWGDR